MKRILIQAITLLFCGNVFALTCPDPREFTYTACKSSGCLYTVNYATGWRPKYHEGNHDEVLTNNFVFTGVSWGKPHSYSRVVCEYQDPNNASYLYSLMIVSDSTSFTDTDFKNHPNWTASSNYYACQRHNVQDCAFK